MGDKAYIDQFLAEPYLCRFALVRANGAPIIRPIWYLWENGTFLISTRDDAVHTRIVKNNPNITVCVDKATTPYAGVACEGTAELAEGFGNDGALLRRLAERYLPPERIDPFMNRPMSQVQNRVRFIVHPQRWTVWNNNPESAIPVRTADYS